MHALDRVISTAAILGLVGALAGPALAQSAREPESQSVRAGRGTIRGVVSDDQGDPLAGAMVSALGATMAMTVTDASGRFSLDSLPAGTYMLQAHLSGFSGSRRELVEVSAARPCVREIELRRLDTPVATTGTSGPVRARPIMAAGMELPAANLTDEPDDAGKTGDHSHTETAWRLRHIKRSVLKSTGPVTAVAESRPTFENSSVFYRAFDTAASLAATLINGFPLTGEVNLLTTGALEPGELFSGDLLPRGVAYLTIGSPTPLGDWNVRAAVSQGDLSSWLVAGRFQSRPSAGHQYRFGLSYSTQEYMGGNPAALAAVSDGSRNVGELIAFDRWAVLPRLSIEYGGRYAWHDYLPEGALLSPRLGVTIEPFENTRVVTTVAQRMVAPGAEEFLPNDMPGPWLPPERTFAPLDSLGTQRGFSVERARYLDVAVEHQFDEMYVIGLRRFYQNVDDQLVTLFGLTAPEGTRSVGHYYVANAGAVDADGWAVRLSSPPGRHIRGAIDYTVTHARWISRGDVDDLLAFAPAAVRAQTEELHDVTTSFETDIPQTATRVFVLYKINTGFTRANTDLSRPGLDARFDVQVNQALPFALAGTRWEVLVGVRNLFRDPGDPGSVYDELLVVRPPKRLVGGFLVRF